VANCNRPRVAIGTDPRHPWSFGELAPGLDKKQSATATGNPQTDAARREMRNLRVVQKMHHVMNSGVF
jgi:hypothetical protein